MSRSNEYTQNDPNDIELFMNFLGSYERQQDDGSQNTNEERYTFNQSDPNDIELFMDFLGSYERQQDDGSQNTNEERYTFNQITSKKRKKPASEAREKYNAIVRDM